MISRRRFLGMSAVSAAGIVLAPSLFAAPKKHAAREIFLIGDGPRGDATLVGATPYSSQPGAVRICRYGQTEIREIKLPFFPHAFAPNPEAPHRVITFEKWGRHLAEIDLATMAVVRITEAKPGRRFFGHGAHSKTYIYATQMDDEGGRGLVAVLDSADHKVVGEFETQGVFPHDCQWVAGTNTLLIVNSRQRRQGSDNFSSLVWMDAQSGACLKQQFIHKKKFGYAHLAQAANGYLVLAGSYDMPRGGSEPLLAVVHPEGAVQELDVAGSAPERLHGEVLSLYLDADAVQVTATLPNASTIQVWDYRTGTLVRQFRAGEPRGLAYSSDQHRLLASSARTGGLLALDADAPLPLTAAIAGRGSHLYRLEL